MEPFMSMILQTLASKAVMYPPLKEIHDNYPGFFKEHGASLDKETRQRYEKQYEVLPFTSYLFEARCFALLTFKKAKFLGKSALNSKIKQDQPPTTAQDGSGTVSNENGAGGIPDMANFETLGKLLVELQAYGYPPKELTGELPAGWTVDDRTGLPKVDDISAAANACTLM
ncbi:hypothetical protein COOONC_26059 [Cooperia oncophora]